MCNLIDQASGAWDSQLVRQVFYPLDTEGILAMPCPRLAGKDVWAWAWESSGIFLVKSAYREIIDKRCSEGVATNSSLWEEHMWKALGASKNLGVLVACAEQYGAHLW